MSDGTFSPFSTAMHGWFTLRQPVTLALYFANQLAIVNAHWEYARSLARKRADRVRRGHVGVEAV
jgi:hypothetical protein